MGGFFVLQELVAMGKKGAFYRSHEKKSRCRKNNPGDSGLWGPETPAPPETPGSLRTRVQ